MTLSDRLRAYPPVLCRLLAREGRRGHARALTTAEIAERSELLSETEVLLISTRTEWDHVAVADMLAFLHGCGIDLLKIEPQTDIMRKAAARGNIPAYLKRSPEWESVLKTLVERHAGMAP